MRGMSRLQYSVLLVFALVLVSFVLSTVTSQDEGLSIVKDKIAMSALDVDAPIIEESDPRFQEYQTKKNNFETTFKDLTKEQIQTLFSEDEKKSFSAEEAKSFYESISSTMQNYVQNINEAWKEQLASNDGTVTPSMKGFVSAHLGKEFTVNPGVKDLSIQAEAYDGTSSEGAKSVTIETKTGVKAKINAGAGDVTVNEDNTVTVNEGSNAVTLDGSKEQSEEVEVSKEGEALVLKVAGLNLNVEGEITLQGTDITKMSTSAQVTVSEGGRSYSVSSQSETSTFELVKGSAESMVGTDVKVTFNPVEGDSFSVNVMGRGVVTTDANALTGDGYKGVQRLVVDTSSHEVTYTSFGKQSRSGGDEIASMQFLGSEHALPSTYSYTVDGAESISGKTVTGIDSPIFRSDGSFDPKATPETWSSRSNPATSVEPPKSLSSSTDVTSAPAKPTVETPATTPPRCTGPECQATRDALDVAQEAYDKGVEKAKAQGATDKQAHESGLKDAKSAYDQALAQAGTRSTDPVETGDTGDTGDTGCSTGSCGGKGREGTQGDGAGGGGGNGEQSQGGQQGSMAEQLKGLVDQVLGSLQGIQPPQDDGGEPDGPTEGGAGFFAGDPLNGAGDCVCSSSNGGCTCPSGDCASICGHSAITYDDTGDSLSSSGPVLQA